ncbi:MAG: electron transport complex subunit RsxC [bacterium]
MSEYFTGGVHPPEHKITAFSEVVKLPLPEKVYLPIQQHIGAPCKPLVNKGDQVLTGQVVAESGGFVSSPIHASISGKVKEVAPYPHPMGRKVMTIVIESDGEDRWKKPLKTNKKYPDKPVDKLKELVAQAGIVGLGGATFPTHVKLSPPAEKKIDTIIINGAECEPYLTADHRLMLEQGEELLEGIEIIQKILGVKQAIIGIEDNKMDAVHHLRLLDKDLLNVRVVPLTTHYPQGSEKHLVKALTGREIPPPPGLPMDAGVVVHNVGTVVAVRDAVVLGKPLIERVVTVTGQVNKPRNVSVRMGTPISQVIDFCGGFRGTPGKVILGGPMMGMAQHTLDVPVIKGTSGILVQGEDEVFTDPYQTCIRCGFCVGACPMLLLPNLLGLYCEKGMYEEAAGEDLTACIECGSCVYVCPAKRPMVQWVKLGKFDLAAKRAAQAKK